MTYTDGPILSQSIEAWGTYDKKKKEANVILIIPSNGWYGGIVLNGGWQVERSKDGKRIWCKSYPETKKGAHHTKFLGFFKTKYIDIDQYQEIICDIERQIKKNPELVSKDGIGPIPKKKMKKIVVEVEDDEEPPF